MRETKDVSLQEEDRILIDFLDENLKFDGNIILPEDKLPSDFSIRYWRQSERRTYPYSSNDMEFNVTISEEKSRGESQDRKTVQDEILTKVGVITCNDNNIIYDNIYLREPDSPF
jgi:hypothetical protein